MKLTRPLRNLNLLRFPYGNVFQYYGENCKLYTKAFRKMGSPSLCHNGIDVGTFELDSVLASHDGIVLKADFGETTHGNGVWILSDPYDGGKRAVLTAYFHLDTLLVQTGDRVAAGELIGTEGNTGFIVVGSTPYWGDAPAGKGVHLHYGVYPLIACLPSELEYTIGGKPFRKELRGNKTNGAADPLPFLTDPTTVSGIYAIGSAIKIIKKVQEFLKGRK